MDQRPPSAARPGTRQQSRPGTGSAQQRRPKTAGRNSERPPSAVIATQPAVDPHAPTQPANNAPRPQSRIGVANQDMIGVSPAGIRPGSRVGSVAGSRMTGIAGIPVPGSAAGSRALSRRGLQSSAGNFRPGTMSRAGILPPGTAQRPITQQGVSGVRAGSVMGSRMGSRMGTAMGGGRMIADKSYYIGLLNNQLNSLNTELGSLEAELAKAEKGRENLLAYEQRAEEQAQELKHLQGQLADYNLIIDRQNTNSNLRALENEVEQAIMANQELTADVEEMFSERRLREERVQELEQRVERLRAQNNERMNIMELELKDEFEEVNAEAESLRAELEKKQSELEELGKQKEEMDLALANSPLKQQAMILEEQLAELRDKRAAIVAELQTEETPEIQREHFVQHIQKDNEEIGHMQAQLQEMNERMAQAQEELQEFQNEFELLAGDKSERFRELKNREAHMDTFLDGFDNSRAQIEGRIAALSQQIVRQLQLISLNCRHGELAVNVTGFDESLLALGSAGVSASELQDLHVRLQEELIMLGQSEPLLRSELASMRAKQAEIDEALEQMGDAEGRKAELHAHARELLAKRNALEEELDRLETENSRLRTQTSAEERRLGGNGQLGRLRDLKTRVDSLEAERRTLDEKLKDQQAKYDYESLKQRALELRTEYNELLISAVIGRQKSAQ